MYDNKTLKDIITEVTEQEIEENCPELKMSPEAMMEKVKTNEKARKKRLRHIAIAAVILIGFVMIGVQCGDGILSVDADKNGKEEIITDEGILVEDDGWNSSNEGKLRITDWKMVSMAKVHVENLLVPEYTPQNYEFKQLEIESSNEEIICRYVFLNKKEVVEIYEIIPCENMLSQKIEDVDEKVTTSKGVVYIREDGKNKIATIYFDDGIMIEVCSTLSNTEIVNIIENMK